MRLAMAQISGTGEPAANREMMSTSTERAAAGGADVVVFPELTLCRTKEVGVPQAPMAESLDGPFVTHMRELATRHRVLMIAGMTERIVGEEVRAYNTVVVAGSNGEIVGTYRKIHLFDALGIVESEVIVRGDGATLVFPFADQTIGIATCYDLRFPELARALVDQGADVLIYPAGWEKGPLKEEQWQTLLRARAIENVCWVVGVSQAEGRHTGRSTAVDPMGVLVATLDEEPGMGFVDISAQRTATARKRNPSLNNRRYEVRFRPD
jgi:predicted amidohydrolase